MKAIFKYILSAGALAVASLGLTGCQDDFDDKIPEMQVPVATIERNMSILDFKKLYWKEGDDYMNYCEEVGFLPGSENTHIVIAGRVISSDEAGNVFKSLVIQDETAALAISINRYDLYLEYRVGQEVRIDVTGMYCGMYRGLFQLGLPSYNETKDQYETSFMPFALFEEHSQRNGLPDPSKVYTVRFPNFSEVSTKTTEVLQRYQSQLVSFSNVFFVDADGVEVFASYKSSGIEHKIKDVNEATLVVRSSGYANFWNVPLPQGIGSVGGILGYFGNNTSKADWQILLNSLADCRFGAASGETPDDALSVADARELIDGGALDRQAWVKGYIVGAVAPEVTTVTSNDDIEWGAEVTLASTVVIADDAACRDYSKCMIISLPYGSDMRGKVNLVDNAANFGKLLWVTGTLRTYMGVPGLEPTGNSSDFVLEGAPDTPDTPSELGTESAPISVDQFLAKAAAGATGEAWVEGYIVGFRSNASVSVFSASGAVTSNVMIAATAGETDENKCICVQLTANVNRSEINLKDNPGNIGKKLKITGEVGEYRNMSGLTSSGAFSWL